jgi:hypothetical protein
VKNRCISTSWREVELRTHVPVRASVVSAVAAVDKGWGSCNMVHSPASVSRFTAGESCVALSRAFPLLRLHELQGRVGGHAPQRDEQSDG